MLIFLISPSFLLLRVLIGHLLQERAFPPLLLIYSFISLCQYGVMDSYFIQCVLSNIIVIYVAVLDQ